jgi:Phytanoyl-CoA dioxygenase (PhyH)
VKVKLRKPWESRLLAGGSYQDGSVLANRAGLQVARVATANLNWRRRRLPVDPDLVPYVEAYERDGVLVIEDFLDPDVFAAVQAECRAAHQRGIFRSEIADDNNVLEERLTVNRDRGSAPLTWQTLNGHEWLHRLAAAIVRRPSIGELRVDVDFMTKLEGAPPPDRVVGTNYVHADVHYPSGKAWLYLNDIDERNGAFVYAKGSHHLSIGRLAFEYDSSVRVAKATRNGTMYSEIPGNVVRMPTERQLRLMRFEESVISGRANTLVFANVMGLHRRGEFEPGSRREQIQLRFRDRPKKN